MTDESESPREPVEGETVGVGVDQPELPIPVAQPDAPVSAETEPLPTPVVAPPSRWARARALASRAWAAFAPRAHVVVFTICCAAAAALLFESQLFFTSPWPVWINVDEAYIAAFAWRMVEGSWLPYVDAVSHRGPILYWTAALFVKIFGPNWYAVRILGGLSIVWTGVGCMWAAARDRKPLAGLIGALVFAWYTLVYYGPGDGICFNGEPMLNAFAFLAFVPLVSALRGSADRRAWKWLLFTSGFFTTCALFSKQVGGVLVFPFYFWVAANGLANGRFWRSTLWFAVGCATPLVATILRFAVAGELSTFWYYLVVYNRDLYLAPYGDTYERVFKDYLNQNRVLFGIALVVLGAGVASVVARAHRLRGTAERYDRQGFEITVFFALTVSALLANSSLRGWGHYFLQVVPWGGLALGVVAQRFAGPLRGVRGAIAMLLVFAPAFYFVASGWKENETRFEAERTRGAGWQANTEAALCAYVDKVSKPTDSMFAWGFFAQAYINCKRFPASRYVFTTFPAGIVPWDGGSTPEVMEKRTVPGSREILLAELEASKPPVIVDAPASMLHKSMLQFPFMRTYVEAHYCPGPVIGALTTWRRKAPDGTCLPPPP